MQKAVTLSESFRTKRSFSAKKALQFLDKTFTILTGQLKKTQCKMFLRTPCCKKWETKFRAM